MKVQAVAALAIAGVAAQSVSYTTLTIDDCPSASMETMITVTNGVTVTYCPKCDMTTSGLTGASAPPTTTPVGPGYTTVYTTTYESLCPTGVVTATYTVTESCTDATPTWTAGPDHIPDGFTVTTKECTVCGESTKSVTVTEPCGCEATSGVPVTQSAAAATPVQQISDGQVQVPTGASPGSGSGSSNASPAPTASAECNGEDCGGSGSGGNSASPSSACTGENCGGSANQNTSPASSTPASNTPVSPATGAAGNSAPVYPSGTTTDRIKATGGVVLPTGVSTLAAGGEGAGSSTAPTGGTSSSTPSPYVGGASSTRFGLVASIAMAFVAGGLAFAL